MATTPVLRIILPLALVLWQQHGLSGVEREAARSPISVSVSLDREAYYPGEPLLLHTRFVNETGRNYTMSSIWKEGRLVNHEGDIEVALEAELIGPHGFAGKWLPRFKRAPEPNDLVLPVVSFPAKKTTTRTIFLTRVFRPQIPGDYRVSWRLRLPTRADGDKEDSWIVERGIVVFRIRPANQDALEQRADKLLAQAQNAKPGHLMALRALATMPPEIAIDRFKAYLTVKNRQDKQPQRDIFAAVHNLIYLDTGAAVALIADVGRSTFSADGTRPRSKRDKGRRLYSHTVKTLSDMYYTTNSEELRKLIRQTLHRLTGSPPKFLDPD